MEANDSHIGYLEPELSYIIVGLLIEISRKYGYLYKEKFYHNACIESFDRNKLKYISQPRINICSLDTGRPLTVYIPDFLIGNKIILELKAAKFIHKEMVNQLDQYLKASVFEIGYLINFGTPKAQIIRRIYTNNKKPWLNTENHV